MNLYLVQHGLSLPKEEDPAKGLSEAGRAQADKMARFAAGCPTLSLSRILHSGKTRARQTAKSMANALGCPEPMEADGLEPMADPQIWADRLEGEAMDTMLVGHLPHLDRLTSLLLAGDRDRSVIRFANAGITALIRDPKKGWQLAWLVTPDIIG